MIPTDGPTMNYNSVILVGVVFLTTAWWFIHAIRHYPGPKVMTLYIHDDTDALAAPSSAPTTVAEKDGSAVTPSAEVL